MRKLTFLAILPLLLASCDLFEEDNKVAVEQEQTTLTREELRLARNYPETYQRIEKCASCNKKGKRISQKEEVTFRDVGNLKSAGFTNEQVRDLIVTIKARFSRSDINNLYKKGMIDSRLRLWIINNAVKQPASIS